MHQLDDVKNLTITYVWCPWRRHHVCL